MAAIGGEHGGMVVGCSGQGDTILSFQVLQWSGGGSTRWTTAPGVEQGGEVMSEWWGRSGLRKLLVVSAGGRGLMGEWCGRTLSKWLEIFKGR